MKGSRSRTGSACSRRAFLIAAGQAAIVAGLGGLVSAASRPDSVLRPPGALPEERFLSQCTRCQKCEQACPLSVITPILLSEGIIQAGTPKLSFRRGYCDLCGKCVEACPTGVLAPFDKESIRLGVAQIVKEKCAAWQWRGCTVCYEECPLGAIALDEVGRPLVDAVNCNGCGLCEYVCIAPMVRSYSHGAGKGIIVRPAS